MPGEMLQNTGKPYLRIIQGNLRQKVEQGTEGAKIRKWKAPDGTEGETLELIYKNWKGKVVGVEIKETDYGEVCNIELEDAYITLNTDSKYFQNFAGKIFNADLTKSILFHPYDMEIDGKRKSGISMKQDNEKLTNYFYDGEKNLHGFPEVDREQATTKKYWKKYFIEVAEFLTAKLRELEIPQEETDIEEGDADSFEEFVKSEPDTPNVPF